MALKRPHNCEQKARFRARERRAWELRMQGVRGQALADQLQREGHDPISTGGLRKLLARVERRIAARFDEESVRERGRQLGRLGLIVDEAMAAWERSKQDAKRISEKRVEAPPPASGGPPRNRSETFHEITERHGETAYLKTALAAMTDLRKLLGIDAAARVKVEGRVETTPATPADARRRELDQRVAEMSDAELEQFERTYARLAGVASLTELLHDRPGHTN